MRKSKRSAAVLLCGISLLIKPAYAFWPVFDFTEIVPVLQQVSAGKDTVDTIRKSLTSMNETKKAIGGIGSIGSFSENLSLTDASGILALSEQVGETNKGTTELASVTSKVVNQAVSEKLSVHAESINKFVGKIEKTIFKNNNEIIVSYNDYSVLNLKYEEEEEEEEVSNKTSMAKQEKLMTALNAVMDENKQTATELNDILETLLTVLNRAATVNTASLTELKTVVTETKIIKDEDKVDLKQRIDALSEKQQDVADKAAIIIEDIQNNYNEKYNQIIKDGTSNYIKAASAYVHGDEDKKAVEDIGEKLKQDAASLNIASDSESLKDIELVAKDILAETEVLKAEMAEILKKNEIKQ